MLACLFAALLTSLLLSGCTGQNSKYIGTDKAADLALRASGISTGQATSLEADLDNRDGTDYYKVTFDAQGHEYEYCIDAVTGVIIEQRTDGQISANGSSGTSSDDSALADSAKKSSGSQAPANGSGSTSSGGQASANDSSGTSSGSQVAINSADGSPSGSQAPANGSNGISSDGQTASGSTGGSSGTTSAQNVISEERAKQLALAQVPGASESNFRKFKQDYDDGRLEYEGEIYYNGMEYEFEIDAYSGAFRNWDSEPIHD